ncbi:MAG: MFS transporter [Phenylobacterium sp.]|uniref:spinster family MFS transporter n=1 Tax=Phenylobacterium sp. TaxID=1871053 RepID=UPI002A37224C|nr:MFS transporter [Phenylobacterium sp.]MDX9998288.1 MFS transporter [Phenylobacterium sp.]
MSSVATGAPGSAAASDTGIAPQPPGYRKYAMGLLLAIYMVNFLDRQVVNILAEPIKNDLKLTDTQIGMMGGLAFAIFYTFLGVPIARLAERKNRPMIIGTAVAIWSGMTALCGIAQNFFQLILFRVGVGVGEAGCTPPAHSLITDYVPKEKRASALAFYSMGTPLGGLLGLIMGGLIADAYGWRAAFFVAGVPGILFALLAFFTLKEPRKQLSEEFKRTQAAQPTFGETMKVLATKRTFWFISFAAAIKAFIGYGHAPFTASFFLRNHTEEVAELASFFGATLGFNLQSLGFLSLALGLMSGTAGAAGSLLGGWLADKFGAKDLRAYMVAPAIASLLTIPIYITAVTVDSAVLALCILVINGLLGTIWYGPVYGTAQSIVPPQMRATTAAILLFIINLIGLGLGPVAVGALSDAIASFRLNEVGLSVEACRTLGADAALATRAACAEHVGEGVRWALIVSTLFGVLAFAFFWIARRTIREDNVG